MRLLSLIKFGMMATSCIVGAQAAEIEDPYVALECPKLSLEQVLQVVKSGKMIDSIPNWVAFSQPAYDSADLSKVTSVDMNRPIEDTDGNVFCEYVLKDANNQAIAELALRPNYGVTEEPAER